MRALLSLLLVLLAPAGALAAPPMSGSARLGVEDGGDSELTLQPLGVGGSVAVALAPWLRGGAEGWLAFAGLGRGGDGNADPVSFGLEAWYLLLGLEAAPPTPEAIELQVSVQLGVGRHGYRLLGEYWADGVVLDSVPILRGGLLLQARLGAVLSLGPRIRLETQPLLIRRVGHRVDGSTSDELVAAANGHQALFGGRFSAATGKGHAIDLDLMGGLSSSPVEDPPLYGTWILTLGWSFRTPEKSR